MASLGHIAVGMAVARAHQRGRLDWKAAVAFSVVSMLPDLDVIAFRFGIPYASPFGHRGATHSFAFALAVGLVGWLLTGSRRSGLAVAFTVASHPLLDALTNGGLGVALAWPMSAHRYFFPWTPLPVAPLGSGMLSLRGLRVVLVEAVYFLPLWLYAFPSPSEAGRGTARHGRRTGGEATS